MHTADNELNPNQLVQKIQTPGKLKRLILLLLDAGPQRTPYSCVDKRCGTYAVWFTVVRSITDWKLNEPSHNFKLALFSVTLHCEGFYKTFPNATRAPVPEREN